MLLFGLTLGLVVVLMGGMAIGAIVSGKRLRGSCGGVDGADCACERDGIPAAERGCAR